MRVDVVRECQNRIRRIRRGPLHADFNRTVFIFGFEINRGVQRFFSIGEVRYKVNNATFVVECFLLDGFAAAFDTLRFFALVGAQIIQRDFEAFIQESHLAEAVCQRVVIENGRLGENRLIGPKRHTRTCGVAVANNLHFLDGFAIRERNRIFLAIAAHFNFRALRKRVDNGNANAVKAAGNFVPFTAKFATCVQNGQNNLDSWDILFRMKINGNATTIILYGNGVVGVNPNLNMIAVAGKRFVYRIVNYFVDQVVQTARTR